MVMQTAANPADGARLINQSVAAFKARDRDTAAAFLAEAVRINPPIGTKWGAVSRLASTMGEVTLALTAARRWMAADPGPEPRQAYANMLSQNGRAEEALREAQVLVRDRPNDPSALHFLATCQVQFSDNEAAEANLRRIIDLPTVALGAENAWNVLAGIKKFKAGDPDIPRMEALLERIGTTADRRLNRVVLLYALGKAYDESGDVERAFAAYDEAARLQMPDSDFDPDKSDMFVEEVLTRFDRDFLEHLPRSEADSGRPIFVLGLPRSGTTLVEQILVSHSAIKDGAEVNLFRHAAMAVPSFAPDAIRKAFDGPGGATLPTRIGRAYLHMLDERFGKDGMVIDKTLNQTRFLGLLHRVVPNGKLIWLRRDPAAIAWSCYRNRFVKGADWTRSLVHMARYFKGEDRLHAHWSEVLGERLLTVQYEDLVNEPDQWMRRIIAHVGLEWEEQVRDFHQTDRAVTTASFAQVRQPLYSSSKEAWRKYERHLKPFLDEYARK
ncbi:hypothetical protein GVN24_21000 [Rhizobium sp. CRIBSB]|nr:hypothetical protein [Rhizobium sp. CRIBSB]